MDKSVSALISLYGKQFDIHFLENVTKIHKYIIKVHCTVLQFYVNFCEWQIAVSNNLIIN